MMTRNSVAFCAAFAAIVIASESSAANEAIWIEGEDYISSTFVETQGAGRWYHNDKISMDLLSAADPGISEGDWHSHYTSNSFLDSAVATYAFTVTEDGSYTWWIRLNPFSNRNGGGDYSYSFDNGPWLPIDLSYVTSRLDLVEPGVDIRFIAWTFGDVFQMAKGSHTLKVRISDRYGNDREAHGGIDAMAFTNFPWAPTGVVRPDPNPPAPGPDDWFMLMAGPDPHSAESIIDMSYLIEKPAGAHGFLSEVLGSRREHVFDRAGATSTGTVLCQARHQHGAPAPGTDCARPAANERSQPAVRSRQTGQMGPMVLDPQGQRYLHDMVAVLPTRNNSRRRLPGGSLQ
ncbi:MAG: hypothetical protein ACYTBS_18080 [Planctomycetota bacterium]